MSSLADKLAELERMAERHGQREEQTWEQNRLQCWVDDFEDFLLPEPPEDYHCPVCGNDDWEFHEGQWRPHAKVDRPATNVCRWCGFTEEAILFAPMA